MSIASLKDGLDFEGIGRDMHDLAGELYPICRSITGNGFRRTRRILSLFLNWARS